MSQPSRTAASHINALCRKNYAKRNIVLPVKPASPKNKTEES